MNKETKERECPFCWTDFVGLTCPKCNVTIPSGSEKTYVSTTHDHPPGKGLQEDVH